MGGFSAADRTDTPTGSLPRSPDEHAKDQVCVADGTGDGARDFDGQAGREYHHRRQRRPGWFHVGPGGGRAVYRSTSTRRPVRADS